MDKIETDTEKVAFDNSLFPYKGFTIKAMYLKGSDGDAFVEIFRDGHAHRSFYYPAYKIWNLAAHFEDIVDGEIAGHDGSYRAASWNGIASMGSPQPLSAPENDEKGQ